MKKRGLSAKDRPKKMIEAGLHILIGSPSRGTVGDLKSELKELAVGDELEWTGGQDLTTVRTYANTLKREGEGVWTVTTSEDGNPIIKRIQ